MRFSRVSIIGTLAAAALALLVILPVLAREGEDVARTSATNYLQVEVQSLTARTDVEQGSTEDTRLGAVLYVSNDTVFADGNPSVDPVVEANGVIQANDVTARGYSLVKVTVAADSLPTDEAERNGLIKVKSDSGRSPTVVASPGGAGLVGYFYVIPPVSSGTAPNGALVDVENTPTDASDDLRSVSTIEAQDGDTITITAGDNTLRLTVDGEGPVFSDLTPRSGTLQSSSSVNIGFGVTDAGSGLRTDLEDPSDGVGAAGADGLDADGILNEPLSLDNLGSSTDINMEWGVEGVTPRPHEERRGDRNWIEVEKDHSYSTTFSISGLGSDTYAWQITATDRVGNSTTTDASGSRKGDQEHTITVDNLSPMTAEIFAGIGFDDEDGEEVADSSSILVIFENETVGGLDALDSSTIDAGDFRVEGNEVVGVMHPNEKYSVDDNDTATDDVVTDHRLINDDMDDQTPIATDYDDPDTTQNEIGTEDPVILLGDAAYDDDKCEGHSGFSASLGQEITEVSNPTDCIDTRNRVYLTLASALGDNETPEVQILGGAIRDKAGNGNVALAARDADDRNAPTLTIGVSGDVDADGRPLAQEEITVTVASGERLASAPSIWLVTFNQVGKVATVDEESGSPDGTNAWDASFDGPEDGTKVAAIIIRSTDRFGNTTTTTGWKGGSAGPVAGNSLDLAKLDKAGYIVEFDDAIPDADVTLNPSAEDEPLKTESVHPFIELRFGEGKENTVSYTVGTGDDEEDKTADSSEDKNGVVTKFDSYGRVELSAVTLDGEDVTDAVARVSSAGFDLALGGLSVGDHTLEFTATDTAGNSNTEEVDFEVLPRSAYEVDLRPGWNLVSFPGDPVDTAIDSVLPADHPAIEVLKYEAGLWIAAVREAGQPWEGELTDIDGQSAYWINTTSTRALEAVLIQPGVGSASRPPAIPLIAGWNLIPVTDLDQEDAGTAQANYFSSLSDEDFVVAYSYDARTRKWARLDMEAEVENGQGVWVYSRSNVILVP